MSSGSVPLDTPLAWSLDCEKAVMTHSGVEDR